MATRIRGPSSGENRSRKRHLSEPAGNRDPCSCRPYVRVPETGLWWGHFLCLELAEPGTPTRFTVDPTLAAGRRPFRPNQARPISPHAQDDLAVIGLPSQSHFSPFRLEMPPVTPLLDAHSSSVEALRQAAEAQRLLPHLPRRCAAYFFGSGFRSACIPMKMSVPPSFVTSLKLAGSSTRFFGVGCFVLLDDFVIFLPSFPAARLIASSSLNSWVRARRVHHQGVRLRLIAFCNAILKRGHCISHIVVSGLDVVGGRSAHVGVA
jgi:hypothetical protein